MEGHRYSFHRKTWCCGMWQLERNRFKSGRNTIKSPAGIITEALSLLNTTVLLWRKGFAFGKHNVVNYSGWGSYGFGPVLLHSGKLGHSFWSNPTSQRDDDARLGERSQGSGHEWGIIVVDASRKRCHCGFFFFSLKSSIWILL